MKITHAIVLTAIVGLAACSQSEPVQTVEWYKAHAPERKAMLDRCHVDPGELALTPNCVNAGKADAVVASERRGYVQPKPVGVKIGG